MKCEFGYCSVCDKEIAKKCPSCEVRVKTSDYTEVQVAWSNGQKMNIAVCLHCAQTHAWMTPSAKKAITEAHWDTWRKQGGKFDREVVLV